MHMHECANNNIFSWYVYEISLKMVNQKVTCWRLLLVDKQITHLHTFFYEYCLKYFVAVIFMRKNNEL